MEAEALVQLVHIRGIRHHRHDRARVQKRLPSDARDLRIVAEKVHDLLREQRDECRARHAYHRPEQRGEPERLPRARLVARAEVVPRHGLEALPDADDHGAHEQIDLVGDRDGRDGSVGIGGGCVVEQRGGQTRKALPADRREADEQDLAVVARAAADGLQAEAHDAPPAQELPPEDQKAHQLAQRRGQRRARDAHLEDEDEQRVEPHVQKSADAHAVHRERRLALGAQDVAQHERRAHDRRGQQDDAGVALGVGEDGVRRAQQPHERPERAQPGRTQRQPHRRGEDERAAADAVGAVIVLAAETAADDRTAAHADAEAEGLNDGHQRKHDADGRGRARRELGDEIGVGGIVEDGDQLRGERRQAQRQDQPRDRRVQHPVALLLTGNDMRRHESPPVLRFFTV